MMTVRVRMAEMMDGEGEAEHASCFLSPMPRTFSKPNLALGNAKRFFPRGDSSADLQCGRSTTTSRSSSVPIDKNNLAFVVCHLVLGVLNSSHAV